MPPWTPKSIDEMVANKQQAELFRDWLATWDVQDKKCALLYGPQGVGKTTTVYLAAKELGYNVVEYNASDDRTKEFIRDLGSVLTSKPLFGKRLVLLDEADGLSFYAQGELYKILKKGIACPLVLTANNVDNIWDRIRDRCYEIRYYKPQKREVLALVKKLAGNKKLDYSRIPRDVRNAILYVYSGDTYTELDEWKALEHLMITGELKMELDKPQLIMLLDNAAKYYYGVDLYQLIQALVAADLGRTWILNGLKATRRVHGLTSYFYSKLKALREVQSRGQG